MFDAIAGRYDLLNDVLSAGQVRLWRRAVARITGAGPGQRVLDLAAGTGTSSLTFTATGADCVACDFSLGMLRAGRARLAGGPGWARGSEQSPPTARDYGGDRRGPAGADGPPAARYYGGRPDRACGGFQGGRLPWETEPPWAIGLRGRGRAAAAVP